MSVQKFICISKLNEKDLNPNLFQLTSFTWDPNLSKSHVCQVEILAFFSLIFKTKTLKKKLKYKKLKITFIFILCQNTFSNKK